MFRKPLLGGFDAKVASAYLLPPSPKPKKKKKIQAETSPAEPTCKQAATRLEAIVLEKQAEFCRRLQSNDLGGGWNPHDQIIPIQ